MAYHHGPWIGHIVGQRRVWHAILLFILQTHIEDVGRGMPSWTLDSIHGRMTSLIACHVALDNTHDQSTSAWHAIIPHVLNKGMD